MLKELYNQKEGKGGGGGEGGERSDRGFPRNRPSSKIKQIFAVSVKVSFII